MRKDIVPKSITFILTQSLDCPSGLGRYWSLAQHLAAKGHKVQILGLHPDFRTTQLRRFTHKGVVVWYVGQMHVRKREGEKHYFGSVNLLWIAVLAALKLTWAAIVSRSDIYHICKPQPMNGIAALVLLALRHQVYLDCDDLEAKSNRFEARWQRKIVVWFENHLPLWVRGITVNTKFLQERVQSQVENNKKVVLVPNAASAERFQIPSKSAINDIRREHQLQKCSVVTYVGSMNLKNHPVDLLLEGFTKVIEVIPRAVLVLIGGGADLSVLKEQAVNMGISNNSLFVGRVLPKDVPAYYALAEVSIDPVRNDEIAQARSPLKLYESLAVGTPVVTGDVGDRRQIVGGNEEMLVKPGDADALGIRISNLLGDAELLARLRKWALDHQKQFYWESRIEEFTHIYEVD
jgi:glycosyltransferase involved in cell wall biosynthesis